MYELILKKADNFNLLFAKLKEINRFDWFVKSFGSIDISDSIYNLEKISLKLKPLQTLIIKNIPSNHFEISYKKITDMEIENENLKMNFNMTIKIKKINAISVEPIYKNQIKDTTLYVKTAGSFFQNDFYYSFKILHSKILWFTTPETRFYSKTSIFAVSKTYDENIMKLHFFLKNQNDRLIFSPFSKMYINHLNYIKYFINDYAGYKEFLWMGKTGLIDIL